MDSPKSKVLIVEDEVIVAKHIKLCLKQFDYEITGVAVTGEEAVRMAEETQPDLVVMDIKLKGGMDGIDAAGQIQRRFNIPVLFLTGHSDNDLVSRAKTAQPYAYILKPFHERELYSSIEMALYKHGAEKILHGKKSLLADTLASIGDAVITTDTEENVTFLNPVAQYLTGWDGEEALGKSLQDIFSIHNRNTGNPAESPAALALRKGAPVRLEEGTMLVNRVNETIPIGDSASPIKDARGNIVGTVIVFQDTTELDKQQRALKTFVEKLQKSNEALTEFAVNASHDLKEPLRKIILYGDRLRDTLANFPREQEKEYVERQQKSALKMMHLVDQLLEWGKITASPANFVATNLDSAAQSALEDLDLLMEETCGQVHIGSLPTLNADPLQMRRLFQNLIGNALKYYKLDEPPAVTLDSRLLDNGFWEIRIEDNGIGFDEKEVHRLFLPFQRFRHSKNYPGAGIGGAICKKIVEMHGGTITAKSAPGKGTTISITLPAMEGQKEEIPKTE